MQDETRNLESILVELLEKEVLEHEDIASSIAMYPQHAEAILRFYEDHLTQYDGREGQLYENAKSSGISHLWDVDAVLKNPFDEQTGVDLRQVAERCQVPYSILIQIEERGIRAETVPLLLIRKLAAELNTSVGEMLEFVDQDHQVMASDYRSNAPPVQRKVTFAEAIRSTPMDPDLKRKWLELAE